MCGMAGRICLHRPALPRSNFPICRFPSIIRRVRNHRAADRAIPPDTGFLSERRGLVQEIVSKNHGPDFYRTTSGTHPHHGRKTHRPRNTRKSLAVPPAFLGSDGGVAHTCADAPKRIGEEIRATPVINQGNRRYAGGARA